MLIVDDNKFLIIWWWHFGCIHEWTPESRTFGWLAKIRSMQLEEFSKRCAYSEINCFIFNSCLSHHQRGSSIRPVLITAYYSDAPPKVTGSVEYQMGYEPRTFWLMHNTLTTKLLSLMPTIKKRIHLCSFCKRPIWVSSAEG